MLAHLVERLQTLSKKTPILTGSLRGIERECLRTTPEATLAPTPHSSNLGSKLTHPYITTDFSENLLEFITDPHREVEDLLKELTQLHAFALQHLPGERFWPLSMPCLLGKNEDIPIADYGTSHSGQMKMHYRRGLSHRYGRHMQCIAGLHYNFSFSETFWQNWFQDFDPCHHSLQDCMNANYMRIIRNYLKHAWLIFMIMGASPACDASFFTEKPPEFLHFKTPHTYFTPNGCSLRMSRLGYQSETQDNIPISYNSLEQYIEDLQDAVKTPHPLYQAITDNFGKMAQITPHLLQIEAELYAPIRPKQVALPCERPTLALQKRGIQYIEVRGIDINPLSPIGITSEQIYFLDTFILFCLLHNSPTFSLDNAMQWHQNQTKAVMEGLHQDCLLQSGERQLLANEWAENIFEQLNIVAGFLDQDLAAQPHGTAVKHFQADFFARTTLPSARQLQALSAGKGFIEYGQDLANLHHKTLMAIHLPEAVREHYTKLALSSLAEQRAIEADQHISYETYLERYFKGSQA